MKYIFLLLYLFSSAVYAQGMCTNFKPEVKIRDHENKFTQEKALKALKFLEAYVKGNEQHRKTDPWWTFRQIEGYMLRREAIESGADPESIEYFHFCHFITKQGIHRE